jgi:hypothetical protein
MLCTYALVSLRFGAQSILKPLGPLAPTATRFSSSSSRSSFSRPGPPPLPPAEQAEFDALIKANSSIGAMPVAAAPAEQLEQAELEHRDLRRGPRPDFEGDVNPRTGEQGGPKVDPFKAGDADWSYGGRVTVGLVCSASPKVSLTEPHRISKSPWTPSRSPRREEMHRSSQG